MIERNPQAAGEVSHDLLVVGGGIYGAALVLEAAGRGLKSLLVERGDFGEATSWNSLRIVHGGFRYLQTLDLHRFHESVEERRWFLRTFPDLVEPLACLMPLYGRGVRRPAVLQLALWFNDFLSRRRNEGVQADRALPTGRVLDRDQTISLFPAVDRAGLRGGALWYDATVPNSQRLLIEILHWACVREATCLNYVEGKELLVDGAEVTGLKCLDHASGETVCYRAPIVVNCAGPWCRQVAALFDRDVPELFRPSLAFNVFLDREPLSSAALAVTPKHPAARTYFLHPWQGGILAGTYHVPWPRPLRPFDQPHPDETDLAGFLHDLNIAAPGLDVGQADVLRVHSGFLPAVTGGSAVLASREVLHDHGAAGGPRGLFSVSGVKFTTARRVAEKTLQWVCGRLERTLPRQSPAQRPAAIDCPGLVQFSQLLDSEPEAAAAHVNRLIKEESVVHLEDMFIRRTDWGTHPQPAMEVANRVCRLLDWDRPHRDHELERLKKNLVSCR